MTMLSTPTKQQRKPETVTLDSSGNSEQEEPASKSPKPSGSKTNEKPQSKPPVPAITDQTKGGKGKQTTGLKTKGTQKEPEKDKKEEEKKKKEQEKLRKKKEKEEADRKKKVALEAIEEQSLEETSDDEEIKSSQPEKRVMLNISKVHTQGGTQRFKSRVVGDKSKRDDTSSSSGGESPTLKGQGQTPSPNSGKQNKKKRTKSSFKHNNF